MNLASLETCRNAALAVLGLSAALVVAVVLIEHALARRRHYLRRLRSVHELANRWAWIGALAAFPTALGILVVVGLAVAAHGVSFAQAGAVVVSAALGYGAWRVASRIGPAAPPELVKKELLDRIKPAGHGLDFPFGMDALPTPTSAAFRRLRAGSVAVLVVALLSGLVLALAASGVVRGPLFSVPDLGLPAAALALVAGFALSVSVALDLGNHRFVLLPFGLHVAVVYLLLPGIALAAAAVARAPLGLVAGVGAAWIAFVVLHRTVYLRAGARAVARYKIERSVASVLDEEDAAVRAAWRVFGQGESQVEIGFELESALSTLAGREWLSAGAGEIGSLAYRVAGVHVDTFELRVRTVRREIRGATDESLDPWRFPLVGPRDWQGGRTRTVRELAEPMRGRLVTEWDDYVGWQASPPVRDVPALRRGLSSVAEAAIVRDTRIGSAVHTEPDAATDAFIRLASQIHVHRREIATFFIGSDDERRLSDVELRALRFPLYALIPAGGERPTVWITGWRGVVASRLPISWPALVVAGLMPPLLVALATVAIAGAAALLL